MTGAEQIVCLHYDDGCRTEDSSSGILSQHCKDSGYFFKLQCSHVQPFFWVTPCDLSKLSVHQAVHARVIKRTINSGPFYVSF